LKHEELPELNPYPERQLVAIVLELQVAAPNPQALQVLLV
jgi:hypothetical protein